MDYEMLIRRLFMNDMEGRIPAGVTYSFPMPGIVGNMKCDKFFLYGVNPQQKKHTKAFIRFALSYDKGRLIAFQEREPGEFYYDITAPDLPTEDYNRVLKAFKRDYMFVREIAFERSCDEYERKIVRRLMEEYYFLVGDRSPYMELSPEFFGWVRKQMVE